MGVSDKIFAIMEERKITKYQVSKNAKIPASSLTDWSNGRVEPSASAVMKIAEYLNIPVGYFYGDEEKAIDQKKAVKIPVLGRVPAGIPIEAIEDIIGWEEIPAAWLSGAREYFALKVDGLSMYPEYAQGETLIIKKQPTCDSGKDAIVLVNGSDAVFKRVFLEHKGMRLHPINPAFEDVFYSAADMKRLPVSIVGVVVQSRRER